MTNEQLTFRNDEHLMEILEQWNRELQSVTYIVSHDLGNPLLSIKAFAMEVDKACKNAGKLLDSEELSADTKKKLNFTLTQDIPECVDYIKMGTEEIQKLLDGLKHLSRVGRMRMNLNSIDMNKLIQQIVGTFKFRFEETGASVEIGDLPPCQADIAHLIQIFNNLIDNSLKYLSPERKGVIKIYSVKDENNCIYCLEDNGLGIPDEHQTKIFEIFHRVDPDQPTQGDGIGLSIVLRIVNRLNGRIWVESEKGRGTKFFIALPAAPELHAHDENESNYTE